jgi:hypothetical protein
VEKTNSNGCSGSSTGVIVTANSLPLATATPQGPTTFCTSDSVWIKGNYSSTFSYQWKKNNTIIAGATAKNYYAKTAGNYKVKVINSNGCTNLSNAVVVTVPCREGENEIQGENIFNADVYPNPSAGDFILTVHGGGTEQISVSIFDLTGRIVKIDMEKTSPAEFRISGLLNGIYMAKVVQGSQMKIIRLVKAD